MLKINYISPKMCRCGKVRLPPKIKKAASNLAIFRDIVFNILKNYDKSIKYATEYLANKNIKEVIYSIR